MFSCKSCTDDGDDTPNGAAMKTIEQDARVVEAISAAKKAEVRPPMVWRAALRWHTYAHLDPF